MVGLFKKKDNKNISLKEESKKEEPKVTNTPTPPTVSQTTSSPTPDSVSNKTILVVGGGPAGLEAARGASELGFPVVLVEKNAFLGGKPIEANYALLAPDFRNAVDVMAEMTGTTRFQH